MERDNAEGTDIGEEGSDDSDSDEGSSSDVTEEEDEGDAAMERAGVLAGLVEPTEKLWKTEAAESLRLIAKGMRISAKGYNKLAKNVEKTPLEILAPWLKRNITGFGRAHLAADPQPGTSASGKRKRAEIESDPEEVEQAVEGDEAELSDGDEGEAPIPIKIGKEKRYKCPYGKCDYQPRRSIDTLKAHIREVHLGKEKIPCPHCDAFASYTRAAVLRHVRDKHTK